MITINVGPVDLGQIDLLVDEGFYANRTDFIRREAGQKIELRVLGLATVADDVSPELALATIESVEVLGAFRAPRAVKAALAPRTI